MTTRHAKAGKGSRWTVAELRTVTAAWRGDQLADSRGLFGEVRVALSGEVRIHFRCAFKWDGKIAWHPCGSWPANRLEDIRAQRERARVAVRDGINPNDAIKADRLERQAKVAQTLAEAERAKEADATFGEMFEAWMADGVNRTDGNAELRRSFKKDVLPRLATVPLRSTTEKMIADTLRNVIKRGTNRMAMMLYRDLRQLFRWAEDRQPWRRLMADGNPVKLIEMRRLVDRDYDMSNERSRVLSVEEIRELHEKLSTMRREWAAAADRRSGPQPMKRQSEIALWVCLSTTCRIGELVRSEWAHVDLQAGTWRIPAANAKRTRAKPQDQLVQMSDFTRGLFVELHGLTGQTQWCFPAKHNESHVDEKTITKQVGDRQEQFKNRKPLKGRRNDNTLVLGGGRSGEWTPHDLRRTAATMMQAVGVMPHVIDRCQNHVMEGSKVRRHYLHYDYAAEKAEAWNLLGLRLSQIVASYQGLGTTILLV